MGEQGEQKVEGRRYPSNIDVIEHDDEEYHVLGMSQTGNTSQDRYLLRSLN